MTGLPRRTVGFIGLGQMGFAMASRLLDAGHDVLAYDIAAEPLQRFAARGGRAARGPAAIGAECPSVMVMVLYQLIDARLGGLRGSNEVLRYYLPP